ncbi:tyrosine-type recombinase/integrase [Clostridium sp. FP2]|uniref:tyrosine-type recombinase/integrase n=1 Tax=Clostridium TaxID=1485 RepID=UPI0013E997C1|nr:MULTISPECIES: tyrosine-type recombinase/integrase [Clostridium]MBW9159697.1 tyrosine-type recombinase/integrase [Clostridium tagluense]MBZ9626000.1 tyrosine-type recombinase/integrase [Clostridium sp. FP2]WLC68365.1 tyrosine-type recombinase/integrase [Clostridium tagluense]
MNSVEPIRNIKTIKNIRSILKSQSVRNELLFIFGINVGLRISDILKLKIEDLVKTNFKTVKDYVIITEKKTGKTKKFYIGDIVKKVIENYIKELPNLEMSNYVFQSRKGENMPITRQQTYRILNNAAEMIGLVEKSEKGVLMSGEIGTHTLRKTFGYHAYQNGSSLELLMDIFNHSSKTQTLRYIGITEEQKKEVYLRSNLG